MKLEVNTTLRGVSLTFTDNQGPLSVTLRHHQLEQMSARGGVFLLLNKLLDILDLGCGDRGGHLAYVPTALAPSSWLAEQFPVPATETDVEEIELDGDEDDEDLSMYEDVIGEPAGLTDAQDSVEVQTPGEYLRERGHI